MNIEGTKSTPSVSIENGIFQLEGRSTPEDIHDFYSPIILVIRDYLKNPCEKTILKFYFEYINSGSKKYLTNIFSIFNEYYLHGNDVKIIWQYDYDDESMLELGIYLRGMFKIPYQIIEKR